MAPASIKAGRLTAVLQGFMNGFLGFNKHTKASEGSATKAASIGVTAHAYLRFASKGIRPADIGARGTSTDASVPCLRALSRTLCTLLARRTHYTLATRSTPPVCAKFYIVTTLAWNRLQFLQGRTVFIANLIPVLHYLIQLCPKQSSFSWDMVATHGVSSWLYLRNGTLYGIRNPTTVPASPDRPCDSVGTSVLKHPVMIASSLNSDGHTSTPISHEAIRNCPVGFAASPHACFDKFAEVTNAQSIVSFLFVRIYVLICGAARSLPPSRKSLAVLKRGV